MVRKGRTKESVAGERYDSNAIPLDMQRAGVTRTRPTGGSAGGLPPGMPPMPANMQEMMQQMMASGMMPPGMGMPPPPPARGAGAAAGGMPGMPMGMPGIPGMSPGMVPPPGMVMISRQQKLYRGVPPETDVSHFLTFYPNYINANKTIPEGRRIPKANACDDPLVEEMSEICDFFKIPHVVEPGKLYPRDSMKNGRIRLQLRKPDGSFYQEDIQTRKHLMLKMGELIPKLQSRKTRLERQAAAKNANAMSAAASSSGTSSSNKKKSKKKGRR